MQPNFYIDYFLSVSYEGFSQTPNVQVKLPKKDRGCLLPSEIVDFCFPNGNEKTTEEPIIPYTLSPIFVDNSGHKLYLTCLCFSRAIIDVSIKAKNKSSNLSNVTPNMAYVAHCFCLVSHFASNTDDMIGCLRFIHTSFLKEKQLPFDTINKLLNIDRNLETQIKLSKDINISISLPVSRSFSHPKADLNALFRVLSIDNVLLLFTALLTDRKILLTSKFYALPCVVGHALEAILYPLKYQFEFLPVLPFSWIENFNCTRSFMIGINTSFVNIEDVNLPLGMFIADLDNNKVKLPSTVPSLPESLHNPLRNGIKSALFPEFLSPDLAYPMKTPSSDNVPLIIQYHFICFFVSILSNFPGFLMHGRANPKPVIIFASEPFVQTTNLDLEISTNDLLKNMVESAAFENFIQEYGPYHREKTLFDLCLNDFQTNGGALFSFSKFKIWVNDCSLGAVSIASPIQGIPVFNSCIEEGAAEDEDTLASFVRELTLESERLINERLVTKTKNVLEMRSSTYLRLFFLKLLEQTDNCLLSKENFKILCSVLTVCLTGNFRTICEPARLMLPILSKFYTELNNVDMYLHYRLQSHPVWQNSGFWQFFFYSELEIAIMKLHMHSHEDDNKITRSSHLLKFLKTVSRNPSSSAELIEEEKTSLFGSLVILIRQLVSVNSSFSFSQNLISDICRLCDLDDRSLQILHEMCQAQKVQNKRVKSQWDIPKIDKICDIRMSDLLSNERIMFSIKAQCMRNDNGLPFIYDGNLFITNYRISFKGFSSTDYSSGIPSVVQTISSQPRKSIEINIPLGSIFNVKSIEKEYIGTLDWSFPESIEILSVCFLTLKVAMDSPKQKDWAIFLNKAYAFQNLSQVFALESFLGSKSHINTSTAKRPDSGSSIFSKIKLTPKDINKANRQISSKTSFLSSNTSIQEDQKSVYLNDLDRLQIIKSETVEDLTTENEQALDNKNNHRKLNINEENDNNDSKSRVTSASSVSSVSSVSSRRGNISKSDLATASGDAHWRISYANSNFKLCGSYPRFLCVPSHIPDHDLPKTMALFKDNRMPILCWQDECTKACLIRSGSLLVQSELLEQIVSNDISSEGPSSYIFSSSVTSSGYAIPEISLEEIRQSFKQLLLLCHSEDSYFYTNLEACGWLSTVSTWLSTARDISLWLVQKSNANVILALEDDRDTSAALSSLIQILCDPFYRSIDGFCVLIEKEWLYLGHPFSTRNGFIFEESATSESERTPVFTLFLDCVWQLLQQYPFAFEFNETFLSFMSYHSTSLRFGTFLQNCQKDRIEQRLKESTFSFWDFIAKGHDQTPIFYNFLYQENKKETLYPYSNISTLKLWRSFYLNENILDFDEFDTIQDNALGELLIQESQLYASLLSNQSNSLSFNWKNLWNDHLRKVGMKNPDEMQFLNNVDATLDNTNQSQNNHIDNIKVQLGPRISRLTENLQAQLQKQQSLEPKNLSLTVKALGMDHQNDSVAIQKAQEINNVLMEGYLWKLGSIRKNWKRRWFLLPKNDPCLYYYESPGIKLKGTINISQISSYRSFEAEEVDSIWYSIELAYPGRRYIIRSQVKEIRDKWFKMFEYCKETTKALQVAI